MNVLKLFRLIPQKWAESLAIFTPTTFIPFFLVTIKTWLETYKKVLLQWPLLYWILFCFSLIYIAFVYDTLLVSFDSQLFFFSMIVISILSFLYALTVRPSVDLKDYDYFMHFMPRGLSWTLYIAFIYIFFNPQALAPFSEAFIGVYIGASAILLLISQQNKYKTLGQIVLYVGISLGLIIVHYGIQYSHQYTPVLPFVLVLKDLSYYIFMVKRCVFNFCLVVPSFYLVVSFLSPFLVFSLFFILDTRLNIKEQLQALGKAFLMVIYNYPFCFIIYWLSWLVIYVIEKINIYLPYRFIMPVLVLAVIMPFYYSMLSNFYFKRLHDQFELYYTKK